MVRVTFWLQLLLLVLTVRQSDAVSDDCGDLQNEICFRTERSKKNNGAGTEEQNCGK
jgi:hypothetical protein